MLEQLIPGVLWTYLVLYLSTIIIGNAAAFSAFLLAFLGGFGSYGLLYTTLTIIIADISADTLWYSLGRSLRNTKVGNFIERHLPHRVRINCYVEEDNLKLLYPSKFVSSTSAPFLFLIGWSNKVDYKKIFKLSLTSIAIWLVIIFIITLLISSGFISLKSVKFFRKLEVLIPVTIVLYIGIQLLFKFLSKKTPIRNFLKKLGGFANSDVNSNHSDLTKLTK